MYARVPSGTGAETSRCPYFWARAGFREDPRTLRDKAGRARRHRRGLWAQAPSAQSVWRAQIRALNPLLLPTPLFFNVYRVARAGGAGAAELHWSR